MSEQVPPEPQAPPVSDLDRAIEDFDSRERSRAVARQASHEPFSLRDVELRTWIGIGAGLALIAVGIGGAPWKASFWVTLGFVALIAAPFVAGAVVLWRRERR